MNTEERMLKNFINKYGVHGLKRICKLFLDKQSNQKIAEEFGVTRQRVHQWQKTFTQQEVLLKPFVETRIKTEEN